MSTEEINSTALRVIEEWMGSPWEYSEKSMDDIRLLTLGFIKGVTVLADELKEVLKA